MKIIKHSVKYIPYVFLEGPVFEATVVLKFGWLRRKTFEGFAKDAFEALDNAVGEANKYIAGMDKAKEASSSSLMIFTSTVPLQIKRLKGVSSC